jgi:peptidoglycan/LPS O-acetylase OafA/YrhL
MAATGAAATGSAVKSERVTPLDALRFIAAASVMLYHYTYFYATDGDPTLSPFERFSRHGYLGVNVFFMISGFVILWSASGRSAVLFARARVLRLFPEFWIAVLISATVFYLRPGGWGDDLSLDVVARNLTMIPGYLGAPYVDDVYWTLGVEIKFYVLLFLLILAGQLPHIERWLYGWLIGVAVATVVDTGGIVRSILIFPYGALFASGGMFYVARTSGWTPLRALAVCAGFALSAFHAVDGMKNFNDEVHITTTAQATTVAVIALAFLAFAGLDRIRIPQRAVPAVTMAGVLTYPLYLLHNTGKELFLREDAITPYWLAVLVAILFSILLSWAVVGLARAYVHPALRRLIDATLARTTRQ